MALVNFAKKMEFVFEGNSKNNRNKLELKILKEKKTFDLLNILEFNSDRKRMSVIVKDSKGKIYLFCKGADNKIFERSKSEMITGEEISELEH